MDIVLVGQPNSGKSTLFNALTGLRQKTANYPGVTVERHTGEIVLAGQPVTLVDLPGAYSLAAQSPDEMVAIDVLLGHVTDVPRPRAVLAVVDSTNLRRNLFLVTQLAELGLQPMNTIRRLLDGPDVLFQTDLLAGPREPLLGQPPQVRLGPVRPPREASAVT